MCQTKVCTKCSVEKPLGDFHARKGSPDGKRGVCKDCKNSVSRSFYDIRKIEIKQTVNYDLKICCTCKLEKPLEDFSKKSDTKDGFMKRCKQCVSVHHQKTKDDLASGRKLYYESNKVQINNYKNNWVKNKRENDLMYKLSTNISALLRGCFKSKYKKRGRSQDILRCTTEEFKHHIESQFLHWMSWGNYGDVCGTELEYKCSYDLDHIIPISYAKTEEEIYLLNHWSNFQPLCSKINRDEKKAKVYPCTNLELRITFWEDYYEYI